MCSFCGVCVGLGVRELGRTEKTLVPRESGKGCGLGFEFCFACKPCLFGFDCCNITLSQRD